MSPYLGVTLDQLIAKKYGQDTILESIQVGVEEDGNFGNCNWGYSCAYTNSISWTSPIQPLPTEVNPRVAFERLFGDGTNPDERKLGRKENASILDSVTQEIAFFKKPLGAGDKVRLDNYLENVREIERRIRIAMEKSIQEPAEEIPFGLPENKHVHYLLMYDLLALAFQGDLTRSATFMLGKDLSGASFPESGFNGGWHGSSHHGDKPDNVANYAKMNRYHVQNLAYFADKLSKTPDGDGTLLDHILIYKGSNMGNSHRHAHVKVPIILLGGLDGNFKGNRHIVFPDNTERTSNMLLSLLHKYDITQVPKYDVAGKQTGMQENFGSSTTPLSL